MHLLPSRKQTHFEVDFSKALSIHLTREPSQSVSESSHIAVITLAIIPFAERLSQAWEFKQPQNTFDIFLQVTDLTLLCFDLDYTLSSH